MPMFLRRSGCLWQNAHIAGNGIIGLVLLAAKLIVFVITAGEIFNVSDRAKINRSAER